MKGGDMMARMTRLKFYNPRSGYYHITSRTVLKSFLLGDVEKDYFLKVLQKLSQVYFVRVATFTLMSNHFHLIIQMIPSDEISDEDLERRFELYYNENVPPKRRRVYDGQEAEAFRKRFGDVSCFVQDLKQRFSRWYNRLNNSHGHVWAERFKSVLLEGDRALLACMVYVELNSVRAGIVSRPEEYRFCGLSHFLTGGRAARWLDHTCLSSVLTSVDGASTKGQASKALLKRYLEIIYANGIEERSGKARLSEEDAEYARATDFEGSDIFTFRRRIRYFTDGVMLGSKAFCDEKCQEFRSYFQTSKERQGRLMKTRHKKGTVSAPQDHLLHLHSIRAFSLYR